MTGKSSGLLVIERILRDRRGIWQQIVEERDITELTKQMLLSSTIALAIYGAVLGTFNSALMALTSAVKLPLLFLATLAICLPTLYLFNLVFGASLSVRQALALVMTAITVISMLALAFAPISLFFRITANDYNFFKLLNIAILTLSAVVGLRFLIGGMHALNEARAEETALVPVPAAEPPALEPVPVGAAVANGDGQPGSSAAAKVAAAVPGSSLPVITLPAQSGTRMPATGPVKHVGAGSERPASMALLYVWILLFGFVGTQLAWTLRPFFGDPSSGFSLFRPLEGNFYGELFRTIGQLFS